MENKTVFTESVIIFLLIILSSIIAQLSTTLFKSSSVILLISSLTTFVIFLIYYYSSNTHNLVKFRKVSIYDILYITIIMLIISLLFFPMRETPFISNTLGDISSSFTGIFVIFIVVILEEIVYRGMIFENLNSITNKNYAIVISSFAFAISHFQFLFSPGAIFVLFVMGVIFCFGYDETENIAAPICLHLFYNLMIIISYWMYV